MVIVGQDFEIRKAIDDFDGRILVNESDAFRMHASLIQIQIPSWKQNDSRLETPEICSL
jgi:hypothetical protein